MRLLRDNRGGELSVEQAIAAMELSPDDLHRLVMHLQDVYDEALRLQGKVTALSGVAATGVFGEDTRAWLLQTKEYAVAIADSLVKALADVDGAAYDVSDSSRGLPARTIFDTDDQERQP